MIDSVDRLTGVDCAILTPIVRRALGQSTFVPTEWNVQPLVGGRADTTAGIHRFRGDGWSVVLKVVRPRGGFDDVADHRYWRRELSVLGSGLLDASPTGFRAPRCYGVHERAGTAWLWLEDVPDAVPRPWSLGRYALAARHLGRFNGAYAAGRPVPDHPWLTRGLLRQYTKQYRGGFTLLDRLADHPVVRRSWPPEIRARMARLWDEREALLAALADLPTVLCHGDASDQNLLGDGDVTIAVDWAFTGVGALGEDLAVLLRSRLPAGAQYAELDAAIFPAYVAGLREAGWSGDERVPRLGYAAAVALRYAMNPTPAPALVDEGMRTRFEASLGQSLEEIVGWFTQMRRVALDLGDEALDLASWLGR